MGIAIAIDGPTGAGKTTLAHRLARDLGFTYIDTGALYRAIGLYVCRKGIPSTDRGSVVACLPHIDLSIGRQGSGQRIFLCGEDVSAHIRSEVISRYASDVSAMPEVRAFLLALQRQLADQGHVVMEGRDIGTVVLPQAQVKIFLTATSQVRARRRFDELVLKGQPATLEAVHAALLQRDHNDSTREIAPLKPAAGCVIVDTTHLTLDMAHRALIAIIKESCSV